MMDLEIIILSEVRQGQINTIYDLTCGIRNYTNELFIQETDSQT